MSTIKANAYLDAAGGNTATINGALPGGTTLLGTLNTTSGTTQTLSGLTLTSYSQLLFEFNGVTHNSGTSNTITIGSGNFMLTTISSNSIYGNVWVSLTSGILFPLAAKNANLPPDVTNTRLGTTGYSTATTSVSVSIAIGAFTSGSVLIYGVK